MTWCTSFQFVSCMRPFQILLSIPFACRLYILSHHLGRWLGLGGSFSSDRFLLIKLRGDACFEGKKILLGSPSVSPLVRHWFLFRIWGRSQSLAQQPDRPHRYGLAAY